jgi:hypothetical protein
LKAKNAPEELSRGLGENEGQNKEGEVRGRRFLQPVVAPHRILQGCKQDGPPKRAVVYSALQEIRT